MLQNNEASSPAVIAEFVSPYDRIRTELEDFEEGGIALNDASLGMDYQVWHLLYQDDEALDNYGDFVVTGELTLESQAVINVPDVTRVGLAFNQNSDPFIAYETEAGDAKYYYFDTQAADFVTATLPAGSKWVACCLDDHRITQTGTSDTILAYIRSGTLYYRQERERFMTERALATGVGNAKLHRVGMTENLRLKFEVRVGGGTRLCDIVGDICLHNGLIGAELELTELCPTEVRGVLISTQAGGVEFIRSLQRTYFFDLVQIGAKLHGLIRGRPIVGTITRDDLLGDDDVEYETGRDLEIEYPRKLHMKYSSAESDYGDDHVFSEIRSPDRNFRTESTVSSPVNFESAEANQRVEIMHKQAVMELSGRVRFRLPDSFAWLTPADPIMLEVRADVFRRIRIEQIIEGDGELHIRGVHDRGSMYQSVAEGVTFEPPTAPPPNLPGVTTWEYLDLPSLGRDDLHASVAGRGDSTAWFGAMIQRQDGTDWVDEAQLDHADTIGELDTDLAWAPAEYPDEVSSFIVTTNKSLFSVSQDQIYSGANRAAIGSHQSGWEIIQFRDAEQQSDGSWRLSWLFRGRKNTTPNAHTAGAKFVLLTDPTEFDLAPELIGATFNLRVPSLGTVPSDALPREVTFTGLSQREWSPRDLVAVQEASDWTFTWTPRYRLGSSANPIPSAHFHGWRIRITVGSTVVVKTINNTTPQFDYPAAAQAADFGSAQGSFDDVEIRALNHLGGYGDPLSEAVT